MEKVRFGLIGIGAQGGAYAGFLTGQGGFPGIPAELAPQMHHQGDAQDLIEGREDGGVQARPFESVRRKAISSPKGSARARNSAARPARATKSPSSPCLPLRRRARRAANTARATSRMMSSIPRNRIVPWQDQRGR